MITHRKCDAAEFSARDAFGQRVRAVRAKSPLLAKAARSGAPIAGMGSIPTIDAAAFHPSIFLGFSRMGRC